MSDTLIDIEENCPICLDKLDNFITTTVCKHSFHKKCLSEWIKIRHTCPICRRKLIEKITHCKKIGIIIIEFFIIVFFIINILPRLILLETLSIASFLLLIVKECFNEGRYIRTIIFFIIFILTLIVFFIEVLVLFFTVIGIVYILEPSPYHS